MCTATLLPAVTSQSQSWLRMLNVGHRWSGGVALLMSLTPSGLDGLTSESPSRSDPYGENETSLQAL